VTWFGLSSTSTDRAVFYADNLILGPPDAEKVKGAAALPAIKGRKAPEPPRPRPQNADQLAGHWKLDEDGLQLADSSGNGLDGELGGTVRAKGAFGRALYLDGGGGAATVPDHPLLRFGTGDFSIGCWVCPTDLSMAGPHPRRRLLEKCGYPDSYWNVDVWNGGRVQMEMADAGRKGGTTVSAGAMAEKTWTHLAIVVDRVNHKVSYYFNGTLDSAPGLPPDFVGNLDVPGLPLSTGTWQQFIGLLAELRIYRRALGEDEVKTAYEQLRPRFGSAEFTVIPDD
jgi:hypothetical protein